MFLAENELPTAILLKPPWGYGFFAEIALNILDVLVVWTGNARSDL